ncbi:MAG: flagellar biosynthesis protein FliQ [Dethiobacteria bacterium]
MTPELVLSITRESIIVILTAAAPILGVGLLVGLIISIFQATTQIQEPTLAFVPKIAAVFFSLMIFGGWIMRIIMTFTFDLWSHLGGNF